MRTQIKFCSLCITVLMLVLGGVPAKSWATVTPYVANMGSAQQYAVLMAGSADSVFKVQGNAGIVGDVGVGSNVTIDLQSSGKSASIEGNLFTVTPVSLPGGVLDGTMTQAPDVVNMAISDAITFSQTIAGFTATQTFGTIDASTTVTGNGGVNVIDLVGGGIDLGKKEVLTLSGNASDIFYVNLLNGADFSIAGAIALAGGVNPNNVYWNIVDGQKANISGGTVYGTILNNVGSDATDFVMKNATLYGRIMGGEGSVSILNSSVTGGGSGGGAVAQAPEVRSIAMGAILGVFMLLSGVRRRLRSAKPTLEFA